jgi:hypothetical protein
MIINEEELRRVIQRLLVEENTYGSVEAADEYSGPFDFIGTIRSKIRSWAPEEFNASSTGATVYSDPAKFNISEVYEDSTKDIVTDRIEKDTFKIMPNFGAQLDSSATTTDNISTSFDKDLKTLEKKFDKLLRSSPTGALNNLLADLNTILLPFNLKLSNVEIKPMLRWYEKNKKSADAKLFLERIKMEALRIYPEKFKNIQSDIEFAHEKEYLTDAQKEKYEKLLEKIERSKT